MLIEARRACATLIVFSVFVAAQFTYVAPTSAIKDLPGKINGNLVHCINNVTADTAAVQAAANVSGSSVFESNGACLVTGIAFAASNITWNLNGTTIKHDATGAANYLLSDSGHSNIEIYGGVLDDNGVLQSTLHLFMTNFYHGVGIKIHDMIYRNSGTARPTMGASYSEGTTFSFVSSSIENTITSFHIYNDSAAMAVQVRIEANRSDGSNTNAIYSQYSYVAGSEETIARNHISNVGTDASDGQCGSNTGECGNAILVTLSYGVDVADNNISTMAFSCGRVSYSAHVNVHGGVCDKAAENAFWSEYPSSNGASGNIFSDLTITNSFSGINNTNIFAVGNIGSSDPDIITGNKMFNLASYGIHAENALVTNNEVTEAAICYEVGYGTVGYGNLLNSNSCTRSGAAYVVSQGLSDTPDDQLGLINVQAPINAGLPLIVPVNGPGTLNVTNAVNNAGSLQLTTSGAATSGATYLLRGFYGQAGANGKLCTASASSTTFTCTGLATPAGTWATTVTSTGAELIYSSGTTLAYTVPSVVLDKH